MVNKKEFPKGTIILFASLLVLLILIYINQSATKRTIPQDLIAVLRPDAVPLQPFMLIDQSGEPFTEKRLKGKWSFVFFGYTHCPDICPTTMSILKQVNNALKDKHQLASDIQVIFVSVDPQRDNPETLKKYIAFFNPKFTAVTGYADPLAKFSRQFGAAYINEATDASNNYLVSHTSSIFLVDPYARIVASFSPPHDVETITSQYLQIQALFK